MSAPIISPPVNIEAGDGIGSLDMYCVTRTTGDHHSFTWKIEDYKSFMTEEGIKSPLFTVPNKEECRWYLSVKGVRAGRNSVTTNVQLVLDHHSECKEAMVKFKVRNLGFRRVHRKCYNLEPASSFKFDTKVNNATNTLSYCVRKVNRVRNERDYEVSQRFTIVCNIIVETVSLGDGSLSHDLGSLYKNQLFTDFMIKVGGKSYPVHRTILTGRSPVFAAMFVHDTVESENEMVINDMDPDVVEEMLSFIYTDKVNRWDLAEHLLMAADKYDLKGLRFECAQYLIPTLSNSNAFDLLLLAKRYNADVLKSAAIKFITKKRNNVDKTSAWKTLCQSEPQLLGEICEALFQFQLPTNF